MEPNFIQKVSNWGNFPIIKAEVRALEDIQQIKNFVKENHEMIARGNGRCYGDASLGNSIFHTKRLNKFIRFDRENGILECESGVLLSEILEVSVAEGYFLSVTPGTKFVSVGGAIASNVHGKNHHVAGSFCDFVESFKILVENGDILNCSRDENPDLFWASIGGMGLTGIILSAVIQLTKIESAYIRQESIKAENLDKIFRLFDESEGWTYTVAWIDCLQKGSGIGRSILMRGEHASISELSEGQKKKPLSLKKKPIPTIPFYFPSFALNTLSVKAFNFLYFNKQRSKILKNIIDYETFFIH